MWFVCDSCVGKKNIVPTSHRQTDTLLSTYHAFTGCIYRVRRTFVNVLRMLAESGDGLFVFSDDDIFKYFESFRIIDGQLIPKLRMWLTSAGGRVEMWFGIRHCLHTKCCHANVITSTFIRQPASSVDFGREHQYVPGMSDASFRYVLLSEKILPGKYSYSSLLCLCETI